MLCAKEPIKVARPRFCCRPSINTHPGFSRRKANQNFHANDPSTEIIKLRAIKGSEKFRWRGSHYFISHLAEETESHHVKNNFKKMVHNPNSSNSDISYDSECLKEYKEYCYVKKG
jgi:hypothetical protein